jgi:hypothetical protein
MRFQKCPSCFWHYLNGIGLKPRATDISSLRDGRCTNPKFIFRSAHNSFRKTTRFNCRFEVNGRQQLPILASHSKQRGTKKCLSLFTVVPQPNTPNPHFPRVLCGNLCVPCGKIGVFRRLPPTPTDSHRLPPTPADSGVHICAICIICGCPPPPPPDKHVRQAS